MTPVYVFNPFNKKMRLSIVHTVAAMVQEKGSATIDDLAPEMPGFTRQQIHYAMRNARSAGLVHCDGRRKGRGTGMPQGGCAPARYLPGPAPGFTPVKRHAAPQFRPPASAFELAHSLQIAGDWPPKCSTGRRYSPLGPWTEEATNDNERTAA